MYRRINEHLLFAQNVSKSMEFEILMEHTTGPICQGIAILKQYAKLNVADMKFCIKKHSSSDSYFLTSHNYVVQIENINTRTAIYVLRIVL